jgi:hypothetical protein
MKVSKKFLAALLDVSEADLGQINGLNFEMESNAPEGTTFQDLVHQRFEKKFKALMKALSSEDDLGKIVRANIHIEHELVGLITLAVPCQDHLKKLLSSIDFFTTVQLALVMGLDPQLASPLRAIGNLRNKFAHRLDIKLTQEDSKALVSTAPPKSKQGYQKFLREINTVVPLPKQAELESEFSSLTAQFQVMAFFGLIFEEVAKERHRLAFERLQTVAWQ